PHSPLWCVFPQPRGGIEPGSRRPRCPHGRATAALPRWRGQSCLEREYWRGRPRLQTVLPRSGAVVPCARRVRGRWVGRPRARSCSPRPEQTGTGQPPCELPLLPGSPEPRRPQGERRGQLPLLGRNRALRRERAGSLQPSGLLVRAARRESRLTARTKVDKATIGAPHALSPRLSAGVWRRHVTLRTSALVAGVLGVIL